MIQKDRKNEQKSKWQFWNKYKDVNVTYCELSYIQNLDSIDFLRKTSETEINRKKDTFKSLILLGSRFVGGALFLLAEMP